MLNQKSWRKTATVCVLISGAMAIYAVTSDILRDSILHIVQLLSGERGDLSTSTPFWACILYWTLLAALIFVTIFIAVLDFRYIRLRFALEKRALSQQSWNDEEMRELLAKTKTEQADDSDKSSQ